jgi:ABC-type bacteriocin/lantibiotic exporter with double-glycine peptidase domain
MNAALLEVISSAGWIRRRPRIPVVQQVQAADCGAACLAMVLRHHGSYVPLEELIPLLGGGRNGVSAQSLIEVAKSYGLLGRGLHVELEDLAHLKPASILHWELDHFIVFSGLEEDAVEVVDPSVGRRKIPLDEFGDSFTGIALEFERQPEFTPKAKPPSALLRVALQAALRTGMLQRVLLLSALLQGATFLVPLLVGMIVGRVVPRGDLRLLVAIGVGCLLALSFVGLTNLVRSHLLIPLRLRLDSELTVGFLHHLTSLPFGFFQARPAGDLILRVNSNANIREALTSDTITVLIDGGFVLTILFTLLWLDPGFGLVVFGLGALRHAPPLLAAPRVRELLAQELRARGRSQAVLVDLLAGMESLKAMGREGRALDKWVDRFVDELNTGLARSRIGAWLDSLRNTLEVASPLLLLLFGASRVLAGSLPLDSMLAVYTLSLGALAPLSELSRTLVRLISVRAYGALMDDVLRAEPEVSPGEARKKPVLAGAIRAEDVSFRYARRSAWVVRDLNLEVRPGEMIALVGRSGSGKSTAARLLLGLYPPERGRITYDGHDLAELDPHALRAQIGVVTQGAQLFGSSLREAIGMRSPLPIDEIRRAARIAEIDAEVMALPMAYETALVEGVTTFSGGERQRFALARAVAHRPKILLLDEATSALDAITEQRVLANLASLECTRIVIAHRLSTIMSADRILVFDQGRLVEEGSHQDLILGGTVYPGLVAAGGG